MSYIENEYLDLDLRIPLSSGNYSCILKYLEDATNKYPQYLAIEYGADKITYENLFHRLEVIREILKNEYDILKGKSFIICGSKEPLMIILLLAIMSEAAIPLMLNDKNQLKHYKDSSYKYEYIDVNKYRHIFDHHSISLEESYQNYDYKLKCTYKDMAYNILTSGSTSDPKIITGKHESLAHFILWEKNTLNIKPGDKIGCVTNLTFDVIYRDIFLSLVSGATICLPKKNFLKSPSNIFNWLANNKINILHIVPSILDFWLSRDNIKSNTDMSSIKYILFAGECLYSNVIIKWNEFFRESKPVFYNLYGPSETTLAKFCYQLPTNIDEYNKIIPVGYPITHTKFYIIDDNNNICNKGAEGNVVIRTRYATYGYKSFSVNSYFLENPYQSSEKIFYTGDIGFINKSDNLVITGRANDTIKIFGEKCHLGEIKESLMSIPAILNAEVEYIIYEGEPIIGCFVKLVKDISEIEIRGQLRNIIPLNFIPKFIKIVKELPKLDNGKINKQVLKKYIADEYKIKCKKYYKPEKVFSSLEENISYTFEKEFGLNIQNNVNFFDLGLSSLQITQATIILSDLLGIEISIIDLFEHTNIEQLTKYLKTKRSVDDS